MGEIGVNVTEPNGVKMKMRERKLRSGVMENGR